MPDFEIRYYYANGGLGLVRMTAHDTRATAEEHARRHQDIFARYEVIEMKVSSRAS